MLCCVVQHTLSRAVSEFARHYQLRDRSRVCRFGLTVSECYALEAIAEHGGLPVTALARLLGLNKSSASRTSESLARKHLIRYRSDPSHHRAKRVVPSAAGTRLLRRIHAQIEAEHREVFAGFSADALAHCEAILTALHCARARAC